MGWFFVTVLIPLVAPILLMAIYGALPLPLRFKAKTKLIMPIKDGQLSWVGMSLCVSALYEIASRPAPVKPQIAYLLEPWWGWFNAGFTLVLVGCSMFAAGGAVFSTPLRIPEGTRWYQHYATLVWSAALTGLAAVSYTMVHFVLIEP
jgi:hypothetical protein